MDEAEQYLREEHSATAELALWTRAVVRAAEPDFAEKIYRGWRGVGFHHPEAGFVCAIYPRSDHVVLLFEHGAALRDPDGVLEGNGKQTRFLRVRAANEENAARIAALVQQAVAERLLYRGANR